MLRSDPSALSVWPLCPFLYTWPVNIRMFFPVQLQSTLASSSNLLIWPQLFWMPKRLLFFQASQTILKIQTPKSWPIRRLRFPRSKKVMLWPTSRAICCRASNVRPWSCTHGKTTLLIRQTCGRSRVSLVLIGSIPCGWKIRITWQRLTTTKTSSASRPAASYDRLPIGSRVNFDPWQWWSFVFDPVLENTASRSVLTHFLSGSGDLGLCRRLSMLKFGGIFLWNDNK